MHWVVHALIARFIWHKCFLRGCKYLITELIHFDFESAYRCKLAFETQEEDVGTSTGHWHPGEQRSEKDRLFSLALSQLLDGRCQDFNTLSWPKLNIEVVFRKTRKPQKRYNKESVYCAWIEIGDTTMWLHDTKRIKFLLFCLWHIYH